MNKISLKLSALLFLSAIIKYTLLDISFRYDCTEYDRLVIKCANNYFPVCGWFNPYMKCFANACNFNADNICESCKNIYIEFVTYGPCEKQEASFDEKNTTNS